MTVRPELATCTMADVIAYVAAHHAEPFWRFVNDTRRTHAQAARMLDVPRTVQAEIAGRSDVP